MASTRSTWLQRRLRNTTSTSSNWIVGTARCSSVKCTWPLRITSSGCSSSQSSPALSVASLCTTSNPATCHRPSRRCRMSNCGASIYSCSSPRRSKERAETVATTRCSLRASRPCASSTCTPSRCMVGNSPRDCADRASMRTGAPSVCVAKRSTSARHSPIRGTMNPWRVPQAAASNNQKASTKPNDQRAMQAKMRNWRDGLGLGSIIRGFTDGWNYRPLALTRA